ncbi:uncharacterized protein LOC132062929 [Lycium ferocissimum]|uniref:uncharacterized protein LOC132062929 n=1 Tax=Lycium ferocissimum TaxID=112874 RepID=UPI0028162EA6|nr:uncharacterized protein LOC132062929 [Lycium ferocissimum]
MKLPLLIVILLLSHLLQVFSLSSRFLLHSDNEVVTIDKRGGAAASGHGSAHGGSSGGRASGGRGGRGSRKSPETGNAGNNIPVYAGAAGAAAAMNHHNYNRHNRNVGTTLNCICFSSLFFIICSILVMML